MDHILGALLRRFIDEVDEDLLGLCVDAAVEEARPLDGEREGLGDVELERVGGIAVKGGGGAERVLLACDTDLARDEVIHGHLLAEGASDGKRLGRRRAGGARIGRICEVDEGAVGKAERGKRRRRVGEEWDSGGGVGEQEGRVEGEALERDGHGEMRLDEALQVGDGGGGRVWDRDAVRAVTAADAEDHRGGGSSFASGGGFCRDSWGELVRFIGRVGVGYRICVRGRNGARRCAGRRKPDGEEPERKSRERDGG